MNSFCKSKHAGKSSNMSQSADRRIYYKVFSSTAGEEEHLKQFDETSTIDGCCSATVEENNLCQLKDKLQRETKLPNINLCTINKFHGKRWPLHLPLPPGNIPIIISIVSSTLMQ